LSAKISWGNLRGFRHFSDAINGPKFIDEINEEHSKVKETMKNTGLGNLFLNQYLIMTQQLLQKISMILAYIKGSSEAEKLASPAGFEPASPA
jgi:hypothetical protein